MPFILRSLAGVKTAVLTPSKFTVPGIKVVPCHRVNVALVIVTGSIGSLKVIDTALLMGTPEAPPDGTAEITVGTEVCGAPVVNVQETALAIGLPAESVTPVVTLAV